jgi:hypothetical protein
MASNGLSGTAWYGVHPFRTESGDDGFVQLTDADVARFWSKVDQTGAHWTWTGAVGAYYPTFSAGRETRRAQLVAWELTHGAIPQGGRLFQRCDDRRCIRPDHWALVTRWRESEPALA